MRTSTRLAISLKELVRRGTRRIDVRVIGTDSSESALRQAKSGRYSEGGAHFLPRQLRCFFVRAENGYRVAASIRQTCRFMAQSRSHVPPRTMRKACDLIICRRLLESLRPAAQRAALRSVCRALRPGGFFLLETT